LLSSLPFESDSHLQRIGSNVFHCCTLEPVANARNAEIVNSEHLSRWKLLTSIPFETGSLLEPRPAASTQKGASVINGICGLLEFADQSFTTISEAR
jgi:hypothetical protein